MFLIKARMQVPVLSPYPWEDAQIILRHILLLCQLELSTSTKTRGKLLRGYSEPRASAASSVVWMRPF